MHAYGGNQDKGRGAELRLVWSGYRTAHEFNLGFVAIIITAQTFLPVSNPQPAVLIALAVLAGWAIRANAELTVPNEIRRRL